MKAARLHNYRQPLVVEDVPTPQPGHGQVLVKVEGAGFCHSDVHLIDGEFKVPRLPIILGHENAGAVEKTGPGVEHVREGDPVVVFGGWACGYCSYCITGNQQLCEKPSPGGFSEYDGGYAEYLLVPREEYLVKLERMDPRTAAPLADAALTPYRAIRKALPCIGPDKMVLIIGIGGLGQYGVKLLKLMTPAKMIAVDVAEEKLKIAREYGADYTINGRELEISRRILELTEGRGVAAAFDFVGSDQTLSLAIATTRSLGKVTQIGLAGGVAKIKALENSRFEVLFETTLWGTLEELREVVALAESGKLTPIHLDFAPLDEVNNVYSRLKAGNVEGRVVITPS